MTHFNRKQQLLNTLYSIQRQPKARELTEIIIVDDVSKQPLKLSDFTMIDLDIILIPVQTKSKWWVNPGVAFDTAFNFVSARRILIQNAECLHATNIVQYTIDNLHQHEYIAMSTLCLSQKATKSIKRDTKIKDIDKKGGTWYCHSKHKPKAFNFCAAIHTSDLRKVGGFDLRFSGGVCYEDDMLLYSLAKNRVKIRIEDSQLALHQWHEKIWDGTPKFRERLRRNKHLFRKLTSNG